MQPPKLRVKQVAKKSKLDTTTLEKSTEFYPFISGVDKAYFTDILSKKKFIKDSDLNQDDDQGDQEIKDLILEHGWQTVCENPSNACAPLVKGFYAYMKGMKQGQVFL